MSKERIEELRKLLNQYNYEYYTTFFSIVQVFPNLFERKRKNTAQTTRPGGILHL